MTNDSKGMRPLTWPSAVCPATLDGQVSIADSTHTATITDDETGVINFAGDAGNALESV